MSDARPVPAIPPGLALFVAVLAISWAGPLVRFTDAPPLAIAAWRLIISVVFIFVVLLVRRERPPTLARRDWAFAGAAGFFLALHFWSWITSLGMTTIASSVVLVSVQPVFVGILSGVMLGEVATRRQWLGIAVAVAGAAVIAWGDIDLGRDAIIGDLLALGGALFGAIYYVIGRRLRQSVDLWWYIGIVYGAAAAVLLLLVSVSSDVSLAGYERSDWLVFFALAAGPMMLGHTGVNYALRYVRAHVANLALLGEPIGATLIAWLLPQIHEVPGVQTLIGGVAILAGIAIAVARPARQ